jgi:hypothetical protein
MYLEAFMATQFNKIFLVLHVRQLVQIKHHLREQLDNHYRGSADGYGSRNVGVFEPPHMVVSP